jgi:hypothetical protein
MIGWQNSHESKRNGANERAERRPVDDDHRYLR